jgi:hypothetical protein
MGDEFVATNPTNVYGTFENLPWYTFNREVQNGADPAGYADLVPTDRPLWGLKDPDMVHTMPFMLPYLADTRVIEVQRGREATIGSCNRAYDIGDTRCRDWYGHHQMCLRQSLNDYAGPILRVWFERVLANPISEADRMAGFVFDGLDIEIDAAAIKDAAAHVRGV